MVDKKSSKKFQKFHCEVCDYNTSKKSQWIRHIETQKHKMYTNVDNKNVHFNNCVCGKVLYNRQSLWRHKKICKIINNEEHNFENGQMAKKWQKMAKNGKLSKNVHFEKNENSGCKNLHNCECGKSYKHKSSLSKHKKICDIHKAQQSITLYKDDNDPDWKTMFMELMKQNSEVLEKCAELAEKPTTINNNTQFNVMNYLNTECKDAMNLTDFINSFQFSIKDLEMLNTKGYQEAMEHTFVKQLCDMDKTKRPIHCSDKKRKSFYIKEDDIWEKDTNNEKIIKGMKKLSFIHSNTLNKWKNKNNDWNENEKKQVFYCNSIIEFAKCDKEKERNKVLSKLVNLSIR